MQVIPNTQRPFEIGLYDFVDNGSNALTKTTKPASQVIAELLEKIELADQVGLDVYALGEHHRAEYLSSAPEVLLGAAAARTENIRLSTAVTVLSSDDPVRVFQRFATLDLISNGRAEIMAGRGSFTESFPLFGYNLQDYGALFEEKLHLLKQLTEQDAVTWSGNFRSALEDTIVYPRPVQQPLPMWVAVGGTPESAVRAASLGLPMAFAIIGGQPRRFAPFFQLFRESAPKYGYDPARIPLSVNSHGFIADSSKAARDTYYPHALVMFNKIGQERGWPPRNRAQMETQAELDGSDFVGSPEQIIEKILYQHDLFQHQRFLMYMGGNAIEHNQTMHAIELLGTKVAPAVREEIKRRNSSAGEKAG